MPAACQPTGLEKQNEKRCCYNTTFQVSHVRAQGAVFVELGGGRLLGLFVSVSWCLSWRLCLWGVRVCACVVGCHDFGCGSAVAGEHVRPHTSHVHTSDPSPLFDCKYACLKKVFGRENQGGCNTRCQAITLNSSSIAQHTKICYSRPDFSHPFFLILEGHMILRGAGGRTGKCCRKSVSTRLCTISLGYRYVRQEKTNPHSPATNQR